MNGGEWYYSPGHEQRCQVIETQTLWSDTTCCVWLPGSDSVVRIPAANLKPLEDATIPQSETGITYVATAARVADALTPDVLLAPIESSVIPLPHQIRALSRAISSDRICYLLADEVGLEKTIEAGLLMWELKLRVLVARTLVIAPKGLVTQWVAEMQTHFGEDFRMLIPSDFSAYRRIARKENSRVRGLAMSLPRVAKGQPIPSIFIPGVADEVTGLWSLWGITIHTDDWNQRRILAVFMHDDGRVLMPTARHIWNQLLTVSPRIHGHLVGDPARDAFDRVMEVAEKQGKAIYDELAQIHRERLTRERDKGAYAFSARRRAVESIGLPQVRDHRLDILDREKREWQEQLERRTQVTPEMVPLLLIRLDEGGAND